MTKTHKSVSVSNADGWMLGPRCMMSKVLMASPDTHATYTHSGRVLTPWEAVTCKKCLRYRDSEHTPKEL
jgi:hypothetical protein